MFNVESAKQKIEKNRIETAILKTKIEFWNKLTAENEMGFTDRIAEYIIGGVVAFPSGSTTAERETIEFFRNKIESLEKQLYAIA